METINLSAPCKCLDGLNRREFIKTAVAGVTAASASGLFAESVRNPAQPETVVGTLYKSLSEEQRKAVVFPFDHPLRAKVDNNWNITEKKLDFFTADQRAMIREIFIGIHSPEYAETVMKQVVHDSGKAGFDDCSVALF